MMRVRSNSKSISKLIYLDKMSEPVTYGNGGVYLGKTMIYKLPFFLDIWTLINPHITIIGMTGSGKSYMLKSIIARSALKESTNILILDWNNEYERLIGFMCGKVLSLGSDFKVNIFDLYLEDAQKIRNATELVKSMLALDERQQSVLYSAALSIISKGKHLDIFSIEEEIRKNGSEDTDELPKRISQLFGNPMFATSTNFEIDKLLKGRYSINLSILKDDGQRGEVAKFVLNMVIEAMHKTDVSTDSRNMVVLDEAWRLIRNSQEVGTLFREGRKYGISVVAATQLASDINNEVMANSGCMAVFRLQSESDYKTLESIGAIDSKARKMLGELGVGSCMISVAYKGSDMPAKFFIEKIHGVELELVTLSGGKSMNRISYAKFAEISEKMLGRTDAEKILSFVSENGKQASISELVRVLHEIGALRSEVVCYLHELGVNDKDIVGAYET